MKISFDRPPLWSIIDATFNVAGKPVIFAWGDTIFNPERINITKELHAHEEEHGRRQFAFPCEAVGWELATELWWRKYIKDPRFRLQEEIPAHVEEYRMFCRLHRGGGAQKRALREIAGKLASPLYGGLITTGDAMWEILNYEEPNASR